MQGFAQSLSNTGKEFWVAYGHHQFMEPDGAPQNGQQMVLYLNAIGQAARVTVTIDSSNTNWTRTYNIPANTVIVSDFIPKAGFDDARLFTMPPSFGGTGGEGLFRGKGIHIVSDVPIVAYAHIYGNASSGATMLMPVETWGYNSISLNSQQTYAANCYSWMYVIAKQDSTLIEIKPSAPTRAGKPANVPFQVLLMKGQVYQVIGANSGGISGYELTGSTVTSVANAQGKCYAFAMFSGSSRTAISCSGGSGSGDNNMQQVFPFQAWGKRYLTAPTSTATTANSFHTNIYKVLVKDPATVVKRNGAVLAPLINGTYYQFQSSSADYIEADKPILVGQFMSTSGACPNTSGDGDPEMIYLSPMEQGKKNVGFFRNNKEAIRVNYLTLVVPTPGLPSLRIDGSSSFSHTYAHPALPGYTVVVRRWSITPGNDPSNPPPPGQCLVTCDSAFTAITYGLGSVESYGYNAGANINNLAAVPFIHNEPDQTSLSNDFTCRNTPVEISMLVAYKPTKIVWRVSQLAAVITPNTDVTDLSPQVLDSVIHNGAKYYKYRLPGTYSFSQAGTYELPVENTHASLEGCNNMETVLLQIVVKATPKSDFSVVHNGCIRDTVHFSTPTASGNGYTLGRWEWTFPDGSTSALQNASKLFTTPGMQPVRLKVISAEGCVGDTTKEIQIFDKPLAVFGTTPDAICEGSNIVFTDTSSYAGAEPITSWYWDFGNGNTVTANDASSQNEVYTGYGTFTVKHVVKVGNNACVSDTAERIVTVYAKPRLGFNYPAGCLPVDGIVQFTSTTSVPDGQALIDYSWDFGDPNAHPGNPNVSTLADPTHMYTVFGTYPIFYSVTTANGCGKDTVVQATFNLRPVMTFDDIPEVCENATGTVSVAKANVTNGVLGTGEYRGPATNAAGDFTPSVAGFGTHTIWYVYTTQGGCKDSISQTIKVNAKPRVRFTFPGGGCLGVDGMVQFNDATAIAEPQTLTYFWEFGDPNASPGNSNFSSLPNPTHIYRDGSYTIKLTVTSVNGCVADSSATANFSLRPLLTYPALPAVCQSVQGTVSVATASVTNGATGNGEYRGPGTDANGNFNPAAAGAGDHTIWFVYTTQGGCKDSVFSVIKVLPKPTAVFTVTPDVCLGQSVTVTDNSVISAGSIVTWQWDLGNATNATYTNGNPFTVNYGNSNNYQVRLVAVSDNGCVSDAVTRSTSVHPLPVANFALPASICMPNGIAAFTNQTSVPDNSALTYQWNFGDGSPASIASNPSHTYPGKGPFTVTLRATSAFGCTHDTLKVLDAFYDKPVASFTVSPDTLCQGTDNVFTDLSSPADSIRSWSWNFGDGGTSAVGNPSKRYNQPGNYTVGLTVTSKAGCVSDVFTDKVIVYLQPVIDAGPSFVVPQGTVIKFNPRANDSTVLSFNWSPPLGLSNANTLRPTLTAMRDETYRLTATGQGNCTATDFMTVKIMKPVKVPNAFSPNGDGINDKWVLENLSDYAGATVEIYNRYGQVIFRAAGQSLSWDGTHNGKPLPVATYYYIIDLKNGFEPMKGSVTIIR